MKRILHIALSCFYVEGLSYQENLLPKYHSLLGYDTWVLTSVFPNSNLGDPAFLNVDNYINQDKVHVVKLKRKKTMMFGKDLSFNSYYRVYERLCEISPDIIFIHGLTSTANLDIAKYLKRNPNVLAFADQHGDYYNAPYKTLKQKMLIKFIWLPKIKKIKKYIVTFFGTTPWRCEYLEKVYKIPRNKIRLLIMGVDSLAFDKLLSGTSKQQLRSQIGIDDADFVFCTGGKLNRQKNILNLIEAFKKIEFKNCKLLIFGNLSDDIKQEFLTSISSDERIIYKGWASQNDILSFFAASDYAIFPGTHSVLWEQACGCSLPCSFHNWKGMRHVDCGGNCLFIDGDSIDSIEENLLSVVSDKNLYKKMLAKAKECAYLFSYMSISKKAIGLND